MSEKIFFTLFISFALGVLIRSFINLGSLFGPFLIFLSISVALYGFIVRNTLTNNAIVTLIAVSLVSVGVGIVRFEIVERNTNKEILYDFVEKEITVEGVITGEPVERLRSQRIVIDVESVLEEGESNPVATRIIMSVDRFPILHYGERVSVTGDLLRPESFETDGGRIFDYPSYLAKDDIYYQMFFPTVSVIGTGEGAFIKEKLLMFKSNFLSRIEKVIPQPQAALLGGLVVGAQEAMSEELLEDFRDTGIIHVVVLSGYNVTIVAEAIMRFFSFLPSVFATSSGVIGIVFFAIMTGASATIVRASIMALLVIVARASSRRYDITRALVLAGALMILHNPKILAFDPSFQLSFLATVGLVYIAPFIERKLGWLPTKWQVREFVTATIATQLIVLPILLYRSGIFSTVALPVNVLVLGAVPITMLLGFLTGLVSFVNTTLAMPLAYSTDILLTYMLRVVEGFASLPFATFSVAHFSLWAVVFIYSIGGGVLLWLYKQKSQT
jgi:competence protein ComEC